MNNTPASLTCESFWDAPSKYAHVRDLLTSYSTIVLVGFSFFVCLKLLRMTTLERQIVKLPLVCPQINSRSGLDSICYVTGSVRLEGRICESGLDTNLDTDLSGST